MECLESFGAEWDNSFIYYVAVGINIPLWLDRLRSTGYGTIQICKYR